MSNKPIAIWAYDVFAKIAKEGIIEYKNNMDSDADINVRDDFNGYFEMKESLDRALEYEDGFPNIAILPVHDIRYFLRNYPGRILALDQVLNFSDFIPYSIEQVTVNGRIYGIPCTMEPVALYCNWDKMDEMGYTNENMELTWEEVGYTMSYQAKEACDRYFMAYIDALPEILLQSSGHYFYNDSLIFTADGVRETFELIELLRDQDVFYPEYASFDLDVLLSREVVSTIGNPYMISRLDSISEEMDEPFFWRALPIPKDIFFRNDVCMRGYAWVIFPTESQEEYERVIDFVNYAFIDNTDLDLLFARKNVVPVKNSSISRLNELEEDPYFGGQNVIKFLAGLLNNIPLFYHDKYTDDAAALLNILGKKIVRGELTADEAMQEFEPEFDRIKGEADEAPKDDGLLEPTVIGIDVVRGPNKTTYLVGEKFDPTGMAVLALYSNGTSKLINDYTYYPSGSLLYNDSSVTINYEGFTAIVSITVVQFSNAKKYFFFPERKYFNVEVGRNICKIDAKSGLPNISRGLLSFGGKKLPLNLSLVYDSQFRHSTEIFERETGLPQGIRTNYHQTCIEVDGEFYYTDGDDNMHAFKQASGSQEIWVDFQGTGLLLEKQGSEIKIYDEFGNYSMFDSYGRLYLIHQKFTSESFAELGIVYEGETEKIVSIKDGMNRTTTFDYSKDNAVEIRVEGSTKLAIISSNGLLYSVVRYSNDGAETDRYEFNESDCLKTITAANGEKLTLTYNDDGDAITEYYCNSQEKTCYFEYDIENQKTIITNNKGIEQVVTFNEEDGFTGSYQDLNGEPVNVYFVDQEACSAFSSKRARPSARFTFGTNGTNSYELPQNGSKTVTTNTTMFSLDDNRFSVFSVKLQAYGNKNATGTITVKLVQNSENVLCTLKLNPAIEGMQIAAKPFAALSNTTIGYMVRIEADCSAGLFVFSDLSIAPLLGNAEKFCSNIDVKEGNYNYSKDPYGRVYFMNEGDGVAFNGGEKESDIVLYAEDYLANARNSYRNRVDGKFNFWYNKRRNCRVGVESAAVSFKGTTSQIIYDATGIHSGNQEVRFYSLSYGANGITTLTGPNYVVENYYMREDTIVADGTTAVKNSAYYDENLNLLLEEIGDSFTTVQQQTEYTLDDSGNVTAVMTKDPTDSSLNIRSEYGYDEKGYQISATDYIGSQVAKAQFSYDAYGYVVKTQDPNDFTQNYEYDAFGDRLMQLSATIQHNKTANNIYYQNARISGMDENSYGSSYDFEYNRDNTLREIKVNTYEYVHLSYTYGSIQNNGNDTVTKKFGNKYEQEDTYNKYGQLIYRGSLATYIYANNATEAYEATSPESEDLEVSAASKLYKIIDHASGKMTLFAYNAWGQVTLIQSNFDTLSVTYDSHLRVINNKYYINTELMESIEYSYRTDLNYYSEAKRFVNTAFGIKLSTEKDWDNLNRVKSIIAQNEDTKNGTQIDISYLPRSVNGTGTTTYIGEWKYSKKNASSLSETRKDSFEYDKNGNITKNTIKEGSSSYQISYEYDSANRLTRENNEKLNATYIYAYDSNGNIVGKEERAYNTSGAGTLRKYYDYSYNERPDQLSRWNDLDFEYDACGNPIMYKGETITWERGRLLKSYKGYTFYYDANGERYAKISNADGNGTEYIITNGKLIVQSGADEVIFLYGNDEVIGCIINNVHYYYVKNVFGDVVELWRTKDNVKIAEYVYDAWGNCVVTELNGSEVGAINPIRYRSYYWDSDVQLYYLHTRWYDPEIGRFVNMDQLAYMAPETVNGLNLYAYCGNNPIMGIDPDGTAWWHWVVGVAIVVGLAALTIASAGSAAAGIAAIGLAACGIASATATTTVLAFATVGAGVVLVASAAAAGINSIGTWASGGTLNDGLNTFADYGETAMWATAGGGFFGLIEGISCLASYIEYGEKTPGTFRPLGTYYNTKGETITHYDWNGNMWWSKHLNDHGRPDIHDAPHWHAEKPHYPTGGFPLDKLIAELFLRLLGGGHR